MRGSNKKNKQTSRQTDEQTNKQKTNKKTNKTEKWIDTTTWWICGPIMERHTVASKCAKFGYKIVSYFWINILIPTQGYKRKEQWSPVSKVVFSCWVGRVVKVLNYSVNSMKLNYFRAWSQILCSAWLGGPAAAKWWRRDVGFKVYYMCGYPFMNNKTCQIYFYLMPNLLLSNAKSTFLNRNDFYS